MREKIIDIICSACDSEEIRQNENIDLVESGLLDSFAFIELIQELEDEFDIEIFPTEIDSKLWQNLDGIESIVNKLRLG